MARSEFRFVIDGVELTEDQKMVIGTAIQQAGLAALRQAEARLINPVTVGHLNKYLRPEWYGLWLGDGPFGEELGQQINDLGFYTPQ